MKLYNRYFNEIEVKCSKDSVLNFDKCAEDYDDEYEMIIDEGLGFY